MLIVDAKEHFRFLSRSDNAAASSAQQGIDSSFPRTDVQTRIDRISRHNFNGVQNDTATVSSAYPGTNFHNETERERTHSLDLKMIMGAKEIQLFDQMLSKGSAYFEFGLGGSTLFASRHSNLNHITAVDSSKEWIMKVRSEAPIADGIRSGRISIKHVDLGLVGAWGYPLVRNADKERKYSKAIIGATPVPDVVLVDGRYRVACALQTTLEAVQNGWPHLILMIHDYERKEYSTDMNAVLGMPTRLQGSDGRLLAAWDLTGAKLRAMKGDAPLLGEMRWRLQQAELTPILVSPEDGMKSNQSGAVRRHP
jgi:hypothetical protein